jgi:hypothetical protein
MQAACKRARLTAVRPSDARGERTRALERGARGRAQARRRRSVVPPHKVDVLDMQREHGAVCPKVEHRRGHPSHRRADGSRAGPQKIREVVEVPLADRRWEQAAVQVRPVRRRLRGRQLRPKLVLELIQRLPTTSLLARGVRLGLALEALELGRRPLSELE